MRGYIVNFKSFIHIIFYFQVALAEICAKSERYIGTEGGGMDQSISFLAERGTVRRFTFSTFGKKIIRIISLSKLLIQ